MDTGLNNQSELKKYLGKISHIFSVGEFLGQEIDSRKVIEYYRDSGPGYRLFHSSRGSIHMALNYNGKFDQRGYLGQAEIVQEYILQSGAQTVLELASGRGFNSTYLAQQNPGIKFVGIDLTPEHVRESRRNSRGISNLEFRQEDFQHLDFGDVSFDLVFEVESVCHATDMEQALSEAKRVLKPGGYFIVIDGFRSRDFDSFPEDWKVASRLSEAAMAVGKPWKIHEWLALCEKVGFEVESADDLSAAIMPNLLRFQFLARGFFKFPALSRLLLKVLPFYLVQNAVAGLLMPFTVGAGAQQYYKVALKRK